MPPIHCRRRSPFLLLAIANLALAGCGDAIGNGIVGGLKDLMAGPHSVDYANTCPDMQPFSGAALALAKTNSAGLGAQLEGGTPLTVIPRATGGGNASALAIGHADLRGACPPIYHQGPLESCTGFAVAKGLAEYLLIHAGHPTPCSAMYTYTEGRRAGFICSSNMNLPLLLQDTGAPLKSVMRSFALVGAVADAAWPYLPPSQWNAYWSASVVPNGQADATSEDGIASWFGGPSTQFTATPVFKPVGVASVADLPALRASLDRGLPVVMGMTVFESLYGQAVATKGVLPMPSVAHEKVLGGHAVLCVGYDDLRQLMIIRNSWGPSWGDHGYFYMPYDFMRKGYVFDAWTVTSFVSGPLTP